MQSKTFVILSSIMWQLGFIQVFSLVNYFKIFEIQTLRKVVKLLPRTLHPDSPVASFTTFAFLLSLSFHVCTLLSETFESKLQTRYPFTLKLLLSIEVYLLHNHSTVIKSGSLH